MSNKTKDIFIVGFALFATFFGAGNLIFPPYLGVLAGESWLKMFFGFMLGDVILAVAAVIVTGKYLSGDFQIKSIPVFSRTGKRFSHVISCIMILCIGPLMLIPRTAATSFEISVLPMTTAIPPIVFSAIFFAVTLLLAIRPSKTVDNIGKFLTPVLLIALAILIVKGMLTPLGEVRENSYITNLFVEGLAQGYQTMDAFGGAVIPIMLMTTIAAKGYKNQKEKDGILLRAAIITAVFLTLIYAGLSYIGTTVSREFGADVDQTQLVVYITNALLGNGGAVLLGVIIFFACLTTSIGVTSSVAQFFAEAFDNKIKYEWWVIGMCIFSTVVSCFGVSTIIRFSGPILNVIYPVVIALVLLSVFGKKIKNDNVFRFAAYMAMLIGILGSCGVEFVQTLPLANLGMNWLLPTAIAAVIGYFVPSKKKAEGEIR